MKIRRLIGSRSLFLFAYGAFLIPLSCLAQSILIDRAGARAIAIQFVAASFAILGVAISIYYLNFLHRLLSPSRSQTGILFGVGVALTIVAVICAGVLPGIIGVSCVLPFLAYLTTWTLTTGRVLDVRSKGALLGLFSLRGSAFLLPLLYVVSVAWLNVPISNAIAIGVGCVWLVFILGNLAVGQIAWRCARKRVREAVSGSQSAESTRAAYSE